MLTALVSFWTHMLAAALFTALALWRIGGPKAGPGGYLLAGGLAANALWAFVVASEGAPASLAPLAETLRNLAWLAFLYLLTSGSAPGERRQGARVVFASMALIVGLQAGLDILPLVAALPAGAAVAVSSTSLILRITAAAGALVLVHNVYGQAAPEARGLIRLPMLGLAAIWVYDLNLYTVAALFGQWPAEVAAMRGAAAALTVPFFALASREAGDWRIRLSRAATFQSLSIGAISAYFLVMTITAGAGEATGGDWARGAQIVLLAAMTAAAVVLIPSGRARAWLRVTLAKHFFQHRYDYRAEWLRFTKLMGEAGDDAPPLEERVVKAVADIVEAPAGLLLVADEGGRFEAIAGWNWPGAQGAWRGGADDPLFATMLAAEGRVVDFAALRGGAGAPRDRALPVPAAMLEDERMWAGVPLIHDTRLTGLVLLAAPAFARPLDWEDFDLLRTAARGAASYLAEARGQEALAQGQRFEEFNRRFAFILHDIKNVVSGLSLVARNAERHAANPEFRADMVATLKSSAEKMNDLLARLSLTDESRGEALRPVALAPLLGALAAVKRRRHDVRVLGGTEAQVVADPARLEQALTHLIDNAIDASGPDAPVRIEVVPGGDEIFIAVVDQGAGMSPDFIRSHLFQPFASTKPGGFGIGAHQARALIRAMGGALAVESRRGAGTRFTITLPAAASRRQAA